MKYIVVECPKQAVNPFAVMSEDKSITFKAFKTQAEAERWANDLLSSEPYPSKCNCHCTPCQCARLKKARTHGRDKCLSCETALFIRGGYAGTDLCGPCCTGESETLDEAGIEW